MKFTIGTIIPENYGWTWSTEKISAPQPRTTYVKLAGADGVVDMSRIAAGKLLYDMRTISVTFARFNHTNDTWMSPVVDLTTWITEAFEQSQTHSLTIKTKTDYYKDFEAIGYKWETSRDGIIQYLTLTFTVKPKATYKFVEYATVGHEYVYFYPSQADSDTMKIVIRDIKSIDLLSGDPDPDAVISVYDEDQTLVASRTQAQWAATPLEIAFSSIDDPEKEYYIVSSASAYRVELTWEKGEIL